MHTFVVRFHLLIGSLSLFHAAIDQDRVHSLPGYGVPPSAHYSGYIPVGKLTGTKGHLHYWFIESEVFYCK